jgi:hypothetical protein
MEQQLPISPGAAAGIGVGALIVWLVMYVFMAFCIAKMAEKIGRPFGTSFVMALIPIANIVLLIQMAGRPMWWLVLLLLVPIANLVCLIIIWVDILKKLGRPGWWFILFLIPIVNLIIFLMLAFGKAPEKVAATA